MISLGFVNNLEFVERYINETEKYVLPIASSVSHYMVNELVDLIHSRRKYLEDFNKFKLGADKVDGTGYL
jgi:GTP pyrophosphokinase